MNGFCYEMKQQTDLSKSQVIFKTSSTSLLSKEYIGIYHYVLSIIYLDKKFSNYGIYKW